MSEANKAVVRKFIAALGKGDAAGLAAVITQDIEAVCTGSSLMAMTRKYDDVLGAGALLSMMTKNGIAFTEISMTAEADRVAAEFAGQATLVNGEAYNNEYFFLFSIRDGKIYRMKEYMDSLMVERVLGPLVPKE
jgi:ketosteroid isomerase-like protein